MAQFLKKMYGEVNKKVRPDPNLPKAQKPRCKGYGLLDALDFSKGGIPETNHSKNRQAMIIIDRKKGSKVNTMVDIARLIYDLYNDDLDTIVVDVKERTWQ